ncbi:MAG: carboxypeptidase regulatory-like domain-containing protein, partial [Gemmatimonadetes bacterium]|nr:carboxypeptidase regulatory-like domain-containing protein [Gemmatimonadota bacterium]
MLIGYVSDERYIALHDVQFEIANENLHVETRSRATGEIFADIPPGPYTVTLQKDGFGPKRGQINIHPERPHHFRLLSHQLLGYAWPKWVQSGEQSEFRVHALEAYRLDLWRYGWEKEHICPLGWFDEHGPRATMQITPDGDYTQTGVMWNKFGYTSPSHKQFVTAPERSGLYYFHAKGESGAFFSFPWIVAPAAPSADIAVLAANINWNAYNNFGGRSNYIHPDCFPPTPTINARLELKRYTDPEHINYDAEDYAPLSFDRPEPINHIPEHIEITDPIAGRAACHVAPAEWRFLGWLEREGYAYDLYAETQFHFDQLDLDQYKILITTTHPEYWSRKMYYDVKAWVRERGGKFMYLGGNGLNCEVEMLDEQTMKVKNGDGRVQRAEGHESRFHQYNESEANLLGVVFTHPGIMTAAPYQVLAADHWIFANTGVKNGDSFGEASLHERIPGGASGHETDKTSPFSPPGTEIVARGLNPDQGGAEIVHYETASGGAVFSVGSIAYPAAILV